MKTVLITGASAGIGKETAKQLITEGYTVYAVARRIEKNAGSERDGRNSNQDGHHKRRGYPGCSRSNHG